MNINHNGRFCKGAKYGYRSTREVTTNPKILPETFAIGDRNDMPKYLHEDFIEQIMASPVPTWELDKAKKMFDNKKRQRVSNHVADKRSSKQNVNQCNTTAATAAKSIPAIDTDSYITMVENIVIQPKVTADLEKENASNDDEMRTRGEQKYTRIS